MTTRPIIFGNSGHNRPVAKINPFIIEEYYNVFIYCSLIPDVSNNYLFEIRVEELHNSPDLNYNLEAVIHVPDNLTLTEYNIFDFMNHLYEQLLNYYYCILTADDRILFQIFSIEIDTGNMFPRQIVVNQGIETVREFITAMAM